MTHITYRVAGALSASDVKTLEKTASSVEGVKVAWLDTFQRTLTIRPSDEAVDSEALRTRLQAAMRGKSAGIGLSAAGEAPKGMDSLRMDLALMALGSGLLIISAQLGGMIDDNLTVSLLIMLSYAIIGYTTLRDAITRVVSLRPVDETVMISAVTIALIPLGRYLDAAVIMLIYHAISLFMSYLRSRVCATEGALDAIVPRTASVWSNGAWQTIKSRDIQPGDTLNIEQGAYVPADGILIDADADIDHRALLGHKSGTRLNRGGVVLAGYRNEGESPFRIEAVRAQEESCAARAMEAHQRARVSRVSMEAALSRLTAPLCTALAVLGVVVPIVLWRMGWDAAAAYRFAALSVCLLPDALTAVWRLAALQGLRAALRRGVAPKDAGALDDLARAKTIAPDGESMSGGVLKVAHVEPAGDYTRAQVLQAASVAGASVKDDAFAAIRALAKPTASAEHSDYSPDSGVLCVCAGVSIAAGSFELLRRTGIDAPDIDGVHVSIDGEYVGLIMFADGDASDSTPADILKSCKLEAVALDTPGALRVDIPGLLDDTRTDADLVLLLGGIAALPDAMSIARSIRAVRASGAVVCACAGILASAAVILGFAPLYVAPLAAAAAIGLSAMSAYTLYARAPLAAVIPHSVTEEEKQHTIEV